MLSRVAESIYWMSRYIERAENVARFIHVNQNLILDGPSIQESHQWQPLIAITGDDQDFESRYGEASEQNVIRFLTFDDQNPNSILSCVSAARENARTIRETISSEMWTHLNVFYWMVKDQSKKRKLGSLQSFFTDVKQASHLFVGISEATMTHGEEWHFSKLGRLLERSDKTARILDVKYFLLLPSIDYVNSPLDSIVWGALLKSASAFEMYRKKYHRIFYKDVIDFLIFNPDFPRSIIYCIDSSGISMKFISKETQTTSSALVELQRLRALVLEATVEDVTRNGLHEFIDMLQARLNAVGQEIHQSFFAARPLPEHTRMGEQ